MLDASAHILLKMEWRNCLDNILSTLNNTDVVLKIISVMNKIYVDIITLKLVEEVMHAAAK